MSDYSEEESTYHNIKSMEKEIADLKIALQRYGRHEYNCASLRTLRACDCGFNSYLPRPENDPYIRKT